MTPASHVQHDKRRRQQLHFATITLNTFRCDAVADSRRGRRPNTPPLRRCHQTGRSNYAAFNVRTVEFITLVATVTRQSQAMVPSIHRRRLEEWRGASSNR